MNHFTAILDYGVGNLKSVTNAMRYLGFDTRITSDPAELERADAIILPGVGAFPDAAEKLRVPGLDKTLLTQAEKKPILGICLGMQLLFDRGEEIRPCAGLGLVHGSVRRLETDRKLPHIGWNSLAFQNHSPLFRGLDDGVYVYFVHTFCGVADRESDVIARTEYGPSVVAAVSCGNVYGCQFHPEKSGETGLVILKNFGELNK
ncbi:MULTISPECIES: imidazole glycerol phosphate synthase subunit HisH [Intestinimonas]|jgi:glutamine amidotransferase|uniref:Imidazole glycerol phosphate synthase subunit HisH n=1 Tax=Intestinimonas massiliensis (ex Afouda et al. 2020) TaxID=1673721 RepID=A0ABS9M613_9FIRM|nr:MULTISPECIES: imidazole glycerol phosphate synthase subunit HisH [Intestinimonas]MBS6282938.1 imidazole glycerol phosphate synthase subunit HisH [Oscillospiraceae bacterium]MDU1324182.1 imidazole glycerol phosphate synthase subunit HisH [Clostridiales bacterium]MCG4526211.1 imidazole glycerol phosphate synthase subunit HisH [Intestinimonas massiliensis (ex Afouda et al. 2020)]MCQ4805934.1 imidazole glycerol phosphate synthase subunit HisH [Intestinimonas massiliensis (ex Afouda et al. 2020)]